MWPARCLPSAGLASPINSREAVAPLMKFLRSKDSLDDNDVRVGLRMLVVEGAFAQGMTALTTGAFLVGFALELGATNTVVGVIASIGPLAQILQLPSILLVERVRLRKLLTLLTSGIGRLMWPAIAAIPFVFAEKYWIAALVLLLVLHFGFGNVSGCAFNSWVRDLVPIAQFGRFFAIRMAIATFAGAMLSVGGAVYIDRRVHDHGSALGAYSIVFLVAAGFALTGLLFIARMPEPTMPRERSGGILDLLRPPLRDPNFRRLLVFLGLWNFTINFAAPFYAVYLIRYLGMSMVWVIGLSVLSQMFNVFFFRLWGGLADRFSNKSVLTVSGPLFIFSFLIWPFTTMPEPHFMTKPLLIAIHVLAGISTAGVTLCTGNIAFKLAPYGKATAYLAMNALIGGVAATIAPVIAGLTADRLESYQLQVTLRWVDWKTASFDVFLTTIDLRGLDFVFLIAFLAGLVAMQRLVTVKEEGEVEESIVRQEVLAMMRNMVRQVSTVGGMRQIINFPYGTLKQWRRRRRQEERWLP